MVLSPWLPLLEMGVLHSVGVQEGQKGEGWSCPHPGTRVLSLPSESPWDPLAQGTGCHATRTTCRPSRALLGQHCSPPQALPAYGKDSQPDGEVLLYGLLLGHVWIKSAIPNNGGPPGGTGQDFRPGPGQGRDEIGPSMHPPGDAHCHLPMLGPRDPQVGHALSLAQN